LKAMDPITYVARRFIDFIFSVFSTLSDSTQARLLATHGYPLGFALFLFLRPAYEQLDRMEDHIVWATEEVVEKWRKTFIQECNMSAIAVSALSFQDSFISYRQLIY
jgi:hypothetical protein